MQFFFFVYILYFLFFSSSPSNPRQHTETSLLTYLPSYPILSLLSSRLFSGSSLLISFLQIPKELHLLESLTFIFSFDFTAPLAILA